MSRNGKVADWAKPHVAGSLEHWDPQAWLGALKAYDPAGGYQAFTRLVAKGCERRKLVAYLMLVQHSQKSSTISPREARKALKAIQEGRKAVRLLERSSLKFMLELEDPLGRRARHEWLSLELGGLESTLSQALPYANNRESLARMMALANLARYVRKATGTPQSELLESLLPTVLNEPSFNFQAWRKRHRDILSIRG